MCYSKQSVRLMAWLGALFPVENEIGTGDLGPRYSTASFFFFFFFCNKNVEGRQCVWHRRRFMATRYCKVVWKKKEGIGRGEKGKEYK